MIIPELVDGCHLKCILCWNRNRKGSFKQMELKTVEKVIEVFGRRANYHWYNWGEPLLYRNLHDFIEIVKHTRTTISSNFSLVVTDQQFEDLSKIRQVVVSLSGLTKEIYNIYHQGGNFNLVMSNINHLKNFPNKVRINWIKHPENKHQEQQIIDFCKENNFIFGGVDANCEVEELLEGYTHPFIKEPRLYGALMRNTCKIKGWIPISVDGEYLLCCASHNVKTGYTIWDNISMNELKEVKSNLPLCKICQEHESWRMF